VITAGVFRFSVTRFLIAIVCGRAFRFLLEGYFAIRYGSQAKALLAHYYPWIGLVLAVSIIVGFVVRGLVKRKVDPTTETA
jgi:membrane protein DedA with SNARE-associated domain